MLGRGLEALIPPQGNGTYPARTPDPELQAPAGYPLQELPAQPHEDLLQAPVPLMLHVDDGGAHSATYHAASQAAPTAYAPAPVHDGLEPLPAQPVIEQPDYAARVPETQGDRFDSYAYAVAETREPYSPEERQAPATDYASMAPDQQGDRFDNYAYAAAAREPEPQASPDYAALAPDEQGDRFANETYRTASPAFQVEPVAEPVPAEEARKPYEAVYQLDVRTIRANPHQPRTVFDEDALRDLAASIREFGILQPLVVTKLDKPTDDGVLYEIIAGERRFRASKIVGLARVPAIVREVGVDRERLELAIIENLQREQLNAVEMARAYARLQDEFNMTQREVAARLGKSRETVANTLRLLDLPSDVLAAIEDGRISESHGRLLLGVADPALQQSLFKDLIERNLTTRDLRERISSGVKRGRGRPPRDAQPLSPELQMLQERLSSDLGAPVRIQATGDSGKITISFYSREELSAILERLAAEADVLL